MRSLLSLSWIPRSIMNFVKEMNWKKTICSIGQTCTGVLLDSAISLGLTWDWRRRHLELETWSDYSDIISQSMGEKNYVWFTSAKRFGQIWFMLLRVTMAPCLSSVANPPVTNPPVEPLVFYEAFCYSTPNTCGIPDQHLQVLHLPSFLTEWKK